MHRHLLPLCGLAITWLLLSGHYNPLLLGLGAVSCLVAYWAYLGVTSKSRPESAPFALIPRVRYLVWLLIEIVKSNLDVMRAVLSPEKIEPQEFVVSTGNLKEPGRVMYANSITRTPGTVAVDVGEGEIEVHALLGASREALESNEMRDRVQALESGKGGS